MSSVELIMEYFVTMVPGVMTAMRGNSLSHAVLALEATFEGRAIQDDNDGNS